MGYGLRYDYAQFQQELRNGLQYEWIHWLHTGHAWEIVRPEYSCDIEFAGEIHHVNNLVPLGPYEWKSAEQIHAVPYDVPVPDTEIRLSIRYGCGRHGLLKSSFRIMSTMVIIYGRVKKNRCIAGSPKYCFRKKMYGGQPN